MVSVAHKSQTNRYGFKYDDIDIDLFDNSEGRLEEYVSENEEWLLKNSINDWGVWDLEQIQEFYADAVEAATNHAHQVGYDKGYGMGHDEGFKEGHEAGFAEGRTEGHDEGHKVGYEEGHKVGYTEGHKLGLDEGYQKGYKEGNGGHRAQ